MRVIHELITRGQSGEGVIDGATEVVTDRQINVWQFKITVDDVEREAMAVLQTANWKPEPGEKVRFYRQPEGVNDDLLYAVLLRDGEEIYDF